MKKKIFTGLLASAFTFCMIGMVNATVLNFEDSMYAAGSGTNWTYFQSSYGGLEWSSEFGVYYEPNVYQRGAVSDDYALFNTFGNSTNIAIASGTFDWNGAWFTSGRTTGSLNISGYNNGIETYTGTIGLANPEPTWFSADWANVDKIIFHAIYNQDSTRFLMDDFTINEPINAPVPEPATMLLFGTGLVGLMGSMLRKKKK